MAFIGLGRFGLPLTLAAMLTAAIQAQWARLWDPGMAVASAQPARRSAHAAITFGDHLYVYGGIGLANNGDDDDQEFSDTWAFDLTSQNWTRVAQTTAAETPGTRFHASGALHANASVDEFVLFGGVSLAAMLATAGSTTSATTAPVLPTSSSIPVAQFNDVWRLQLAADEPNMTAQWIKDPATNDTTGELAPLPRSEAGIAIHDSQLLVFGGISYDPPRDHDDLWSYDLATLNWTQLVPDSGSTAPPARFSHSVATIDVDSVSYLLVFSGRHLTQSQSQSKATWSVLDDLWLFDLASSRWVSVEASAAGVPPRAYTSVVSIGSSMWFFSGYYRPPQSASGYVFDDVVRCGITINRTAGDNHELDALSASVAVEAAVVTSATPSLRYNHAAALWRAGSMVIFGGSYQIPRGDVWVFNATGVETREPTSATLSRLPMGVETLVYVLGGFILTIIAALLVLIVRWRHIDRQNMERMRGASVVRGVTKERLEQLEITKYHKPQTGGGGASGTGDGGALEEQRPLGGDSDGHNEDVCPICLVDFEDGDEVRRLPCKHIFHVPCIDEWLRRNTLCPMCKSNVDMDVVDVTIEDDHAAAATSTTRPGSLVPPIRAGTVMIPMER